MRMQMGLDGCLVLVTVARPHPIKNVGSLLEAFTAVSSDEPRLRLVVMGGGMESLAQRAKELGVGGLVTFAGHRPDVVPVLGAADAYVSPAIRESFNLALLEALTLGLPALATPVGIAPELITSGRNGVLAEDAGASALEDGLRELLALHDRWREMGQESERRARRLTIQRMVKSHEDLYCRLAC